MLIHQLDGLAGVSQSLSIMREFVDRYKVDPRIRAIALRLVSGLDQKDYGGEIETLAGYVRDRIRYVRDVENVETLQSPIKTLEYGQGDCDDKSTLLATLLETIGHKTRFHAVGAVPGHVAHVLTEVFFDGNWLPLETTENVGIGWFPPGVRQSLFG